MHYQKPQDPSVEALAQLSRSHEALEAQVSRLDGAQQVAIELRRALNEPQFAERLTTAHLNRADLNDSRKHALIGEINAELVQRRLEFASAHLALAQAKHAVEEAVRELELAMADRFSLINSGTDENFIESRKLHAHCLCHCATAALRQSTAWLESNPLSRQCKNTLKSFFQTLEWPYKQSGKFPTAGIELTFVAGLTGCERLETAYQSLQELRPRLKAALELVVRKQVSAQLAFEQMRACACSPDRPVNDPRVLIKVEYARVLLEAFHLSFEHTARLYEMKDAAQEIQARISKSAQASTSPFFDAYLNNCILAGRIFSEINQEVQRCHYPILTWDTVNKDAVEIMRSVLNVVEVGCTMDGFTRPDPALVRKVKSPSWRPDQPTFWLTPPVAANAVQTPPSGEDRSIDGGC